MADGLTVGEYANGIGFRVWGPDASASSILWFKRIEYRLRQRLRLTIEPFNTRLPEHHWATYWRLARALRVPRMSTFAIGALINRSVAAMPGEQSYVNVGIWQGFTLYAGMAGNPDKKCVGIDNFTEFSRPREEARARWERYPKSPLHRFHELDYEDYFATVHEGPIGVYYYDGPHGYHHQYRGLEVAEPFMVPGTVVFVDDWNDEETVAATLDFLAGRPQYRLVFERRVATNEHPTYWHGLAIIER